MVFAGVSLEPEDGEEMPPLFQTQIDESELDRRKKGRETSDRGKNANIINIVFLCTDLKLSETNE